MNKTHARTLTCYWRNTVEALAAVAAGETQREQNARIRESSTRPREPKQKEGIVIKREEL
jgi:hypothetical protein